MALVADMTKYSVQEHENAAKSPVVIPSWYYQLMALNQATPVLPAWGLPSRLFQQRRLWYEQTNTLVVGALVNLKNRVVQTPWEIRGPKSRTPEFQKIIQKFSFSKASQDYLSLDSGSVWEVVGKGAPDTALRGRVLGLNVLDGLRCYHTGDPEFPVYYQSHITNKLHKMHWTRVVRWVDSPSPDPYFRDLGISAISRAASVAQITMLLTQYQINALHDAPSKGILAINGTTDTFFNMAMDNRESRHIPGQADPLHDLILLFSSDPALKLTLELIKFSEMPSGETADSILRNQCNLLALAIGDDPQNILPLASSALGSGAQSNILHKKGEGKTYGLMLTDLERLINQSVLPKNMELKFKSHDTEQDQHEAQTAQLWSGVATSLQSQTTIDQQEARQLLANNVEAFSDLLLDESGQVRLPDNDPKESGDVIVDDVAPLGTDPETTIEGEKALGTTQEQFEAAIGDLFAGAVAGDLKRQRFGIVARGLIASYGAKAYRDGLRAGGVDPAEISDEELAEISRLAAEQSVYVTNVGTAIYKDEAVSPAQAEGKPQLWWNKSIIPFYQAGLASADKNSMYEWFLGATEEHCSTCSRLNGQRHRLRDWIKRGLMPQASKLECGGWLCDCRVEKTYQPATGSY